MHNDGHGHKASALRQAFSCLGLKPTRHYKMVLGKTFVKAAALVASLAITSDALAVRKPNLNDIIKPYKRELLQDLVTWDEHSLFVRGERIMIYSGEFHPFRYENGHTECVPDTDSYKIACA